MISSTLAQRSRNTAHRRPGSPAPAPAASRSDAQLRRRIEGELRSSGHRPLWCVTLLVEDGTVLLEGTVSSYYLKQLAQEAVRRIDGVRRIDNGLTVRRGRKFRPNS